MKRPLGPWTVILAVLLTLSCTHPIGDQAEPASPTPEESPRTETATETAAPPPADTPSEPSPTPTATAVAEPEGPTLLASLPSDTREILGLTSDGAWVAVGDERALLIDVATGEQRTEAQGALVGVDDQGRSWAVSADGNAISMWDGNAWVTYEGDEGWSAIGGTAYGAPLASDLVTDAEGRVWLATPADLRTFDGSGWKVHNRKALGIHTPEEGFWMDLTLLAVGAPTELWVGECTRGGPGPFKGQGVRRFDGEQWLAADGPSSGSCVTSLAEDQAGDALWVGADATVWRYDRTTGVWDAFSPPELSPEYGNRYGFVSELVIGPDGKPWPTLVTCGGASCYIAALRFRIDADGWTQIGEATEMPNTRLHFDGAGTGWIIPWRTPGTVSRLTPDGQPETVVDVGRVVRIIEDGDAVWVVTENLVYQLTEGTIAEAGALEGARLLDGWAVEGVVVLLAEAQESLGLWRMPRP